MTDRQNRQLQAAKTGSEALTNHASDFTGNTPLEDKHTELNDWIEEVELIEQKQNEDRKGYAIAKREALIKMGVEKALPMAKLVKQYAKSINNDVLENEVDFVKSDFDRGKGEEILDRCKLVRNRANTHLAAMIAAGYQINAIMITALSDAITDYEDKQDEPEAAESDQVAATAMLKDKFKDFDVRIEDILDLTVPYALTNPGFYYAINDAFEIVDSGNRKIALRVTVSDSIAKVRLRNASVKVIELNLTKKSSKRGISDFSQLVLEEGNYIIEITLANYQTFRLENVAVFADKLTRIDAKLVKNQVV